MKDAIESFAELVQPITEKFMTKEMCYVPFKQARDVVSNEYRSESSKSNKRNIIICIGYRSYIIIIERAHRSMTYL